MVPPTGLGAKPLSARKTPGARQTFAAPPEITLPGDRYGVVVVVATVVVVAAVVVASVVTPWVVVVGVDAGHLPDASGATSPCLSPDLTEFLETLIFTQRPDLPALWQSVTFLSACLALPLPPVSEVVVEPVVVVDPAVVVAPVVVDAEGLGFFPFPCPLSAIANDVQAPATNSASASALSFTVWSFRSFGLVVGNKDAFHKENLAFAGPESPHRVTPGNAGGPQTRASGRDGCLTPCDWLVEGQTP